MDIETISPTTQTQFEATMTKLGRTSVLLLDMDTLSDYTEGGGQVLGREERRGI